MPGVIIIIREAYSREAEDAASLILLSAPFFTDILRGETQGKRVFANLFQRCGNLFSFEHTYFAEKEGIVVGMALGYEWPQRQKERLRTGLLLLCQSGFHIFHHLQFWHNLSAAIGTFHPQGYYLSNLAVYPQYQGQGIGKQLLFFIEDKARQKNLKCVELDVSAENHRAIDFYHHLGYRVTEESRFSYQGSAIALLRMMKEMR
ncbi:MAG: GNAT family N-acetyltransferase [Candidatus Atribacteria bacterium]|nr:GNAT family N-acetyltransferase [Candidatus Atribacteria bacterium]